MTIYAWKIDRDPLPKFAAAGCPKTGWAHEPEPPWRVLAFEAPEGYKPTGSIALYTGTEAIKLIPRP
jgi:hypothetical protein